jgi:hypothetical protein
VLVAVASPISEWFGCLSEVPAYFRLDGRPTCLWHHYEHETIISEDPEEGAPFTEGVPGAAKKSLAGAARRNIAEMLQKLSERIL